MKHITSDVLRDAATYIAPSRGERRKESTPFMCYSVHMATDTWDFGGGLNYDEYREVENEFKSILKEHGVTTWGNLAFIPAGEEKPTTFEDEDGFLITPAKQAARFDFLNLLACSMDE